MTRNSDYLFEKENQAITSFHLLLKIPTRMWWKCETNKWAMSIYSFFHSFFSTVFGIDLFLDSFFVSVIQSKGKSKNLKCVKIVIFAWFEWHNWHKSIYDHDLFRIFFHCYWEFNKQIFTYVYTKKCKK